MKFGILKDLKPKTNVIKKITRFSESKTVRCLKIGNILFIKSQNSSKKLFTTKFTSNKAISK